MFLFENSLNIAVVLVQIEKIENRNRDLTKPMPQNLPVCWLSQDGLDEWALSQRLGKEASRSSESSQVVLLPALATDVDELALVRKGVRVFHMPLEEGDMSARLKSENTGSEWVI